MGKSDDQIKKRVKETPKSPISPIWVGTSEVQFPTPFLPLFFPVPPCFANIVSGFDRAAAAAAAATVALNRMGWLANDVWRLAIRASWVRGRRGPAVRGALSHVCVTCDTIHGAH